MVITTKIVWDIDGKVTAHEFYEYEGELALACGGAPSGQQALAQAQADFYNTETADMKQLFSQDEALYNEIQSVYGPIFQKGPNQFGFSDQQLATLNSSATTGVGQAFEAANTAVKQNIASQGGGNEQLPSGVMVNAESGMSTAGAAQLAGEENQIEQAGFETGRENFMAATQALLGSGEVFNNAANFGQVANQGGSAANSTFNNIAQENEAPFAAVVGALGGVAAAAAGPHP